MLTNPAWALSPHGKIIYQETKALCQEIQRINPHWTLGEKVRVPSDFFTESFSQGLGLNMIEMSPRLNRLVSNQGFRDALEDSFPNQSEFQFALISSLLAEDTNGKVTAVIAIIGITRGIGAVTEALTGLSIWLGRMVQGTLIIAPAGVAYQEVRAHNSQLADLEKSYPKIGEAKTRSQTDQAVGEAFHEEDQKIIRFSSNLVLQEIDKKISIYQARLETDRDTQQRAHDELVITKLMALRQSTSVAIP